MRTVTLDPDGETYELTEVAELGDGAEVTFGRLRTPVGDVACIVYERSGLVFTPADWQGAQPQTVDDIGDVDWVCGDVPALMLGGLDGLRLPVLPPWA